LSQKEKNDWALSWGLLGAAGIQLAVSVVTGLFVGSWAGGKIGYQTAGALCGLVLGASGGFINLLRLLKYRQKLMEEK